MKYCKYCKQFKLESEFYSNKSYKDGLSSKCKSCQADYARVYNQTHKEQIKQYKTSYYSNEQNRQHHANYNKIYYTIKIIKKNFTNSNNKDINKIQDIN